MTWGVQCEGWMRFNHISELLHAGQHESTFSTSTFIQSAYLTEVDKVQRFVWHIVVYVICLFVCLNA